MSGAMLIDGLPAGEVPADDRGLLYGDGLFETLWVTAGQPRLWAGHWARLQAGCRRLGMAAPDASMLLADIRQVSCTWSEAVVRLSLTRGSGPRGYAPPVPAATRRLLMAAPALAKASAPAGLRLRSCATRWAIQPALAGLKHLNRLEQVLARAEWTDPDIDEGVMLDMEGRVISATAANLFAVVEGRCLTPALDRCGVAGVARDWLLRRFPDIVVDIVQPDDLQRASEIFLTSSLRGVMPVAALDGRALTPGDWTRRTRAAWRDMAAEAASSSRGVVDE